MAKLTGELIIKIFYYSGFLVSIAGLAFLFSYLSTTWLMALISFLYLMCMMADILPINSVSLFGLLVLNAVFYLSRTYNSYSAYVYTIIPYIFIILYYFLKRGSAKEIVQVKINKFDEISRSIKKDLYVGVGILISFSLIPALKDMNILGLLASVAFIEAIDVSFEKSDVPEENKEKIQIPDAIES
jgi:hypothetical protein